jgi:hypothetical protein
MSSYAFLGMGSLWWSVARDSFLSTGRRTQYATYAIFDYVAYLALGSPTNNTYVNCQPLDVDLCAMARALQYG